METETREYLDMMLEAQRERRSTVPPAKEALGRLVNCMAHRSGQAQKVRGFLYSMWNGQPTALTDVLGLDWPVRKDLCAVLQAFGHDEFFYNEISGPIDAAGLGEWFRACHGG